MAIYKVTAEEGVDYNGEHLPFGATFDLAEGDTSLEGLVEAVPAEEAPAEEAAPDAAPEGEAAAA